jgi:hypothetical protein
LYPRGWRWGKNKRDSSELFPRRLPLARPTSR